MPQYYTERKKEYMKEYYQKNKDKMKQNSLNNYNKNRAERIKYHREYYKSLKGGLQWSVYSWRWQGIECNSEWEEVYEWYSNTTNCYICDKLFVKSIDKCLDHDHELQGYNIRGILCQKCNNSSNEI